MWKSGGSENESEGASGNEREGGKSEVNGARTRDCDVRLLSQQRERDARVAAKQWRANEAWASESNMRATWELSNSDPSDVHAKYALRPRKGIRPEITHSAYESGIQPKPMHAIRDVSENAGASVAWARV